MRRRLKVILVLLALFLVAGVLIPLVPPSTYERSDRDSCLNCGAARLLKEHGRIGQPEPVAQSTEVLDTELSRWYEQHISSDCQHEWVFAHGSIDRYSSLFGIFRWRSVGEAGSGRFSSLPNLDPEDRDTLIRLLDTQGPAACTRFIRQEIGGTAYRANEQ